MRIVCISDTHCNELENIPDGDVLIHAGDYGYRGTYHELREFSLWYSKLPHKHKILVPGNHDMCWEYDYNTSKLIMGKDTTVLINNEKIIDGIRFYGTPDQPIYYNWGFNKRSEDLVKSYNKIPDDTDVLITHTPPLWILDEVARGHVGSEELLNRVKELKLKLHVFGHIHEGYGSVVQEGTTFVNAAICDEWYDAINSPIVIDI